MQAGGKGNVYWCQSLNRHTQMLFVMPVHFQKGSRVPYHWFSSQLACNSSLHRLMYQTHNETLFVFCFLWYWITTSFRHCSCGVEHMVPTKIRGLMCFICQDDHQSLASHRSSFCKAHMIHNSKWFPFHLVALQILSVWQFLLHTQTITANMGLTGA